ncbi:MAG TPA: PP2C family protein-serine/threonine phosphatase [Streptosporangiaceae bacterium]
MDAEGMLEGLLAESQECALDELPALVGAHAARVGLTDAWIYLADLQRAVLRPLPRRAGATAADGDLDDSLGMDSTLAGRAFRNEELLAGPTAAVTEAAGEPPGPDQGPGWLWIPLVAGAERLGVLRVTAHAPLDDAGRATAGRLASFVALLLVSRRRHSDNYARLLRSRDMSLAAELQWTLMPPPALVTDTVTVAAVLEPAYEVGGDAFDFALDGPLMHLSILDALGHDLASGLVSSIALASYRNNRLRGAGLADISAAIDDAVAAQFDQTRFVTGILARLNTDTGGLTWVSRGHPPPLIIRQGRWVIQLECEPASPMGLALGDRPTVYEDQLEPGDRLLCYTDGIIDARSPEGELFGLDRFTDFIVRREADGLGAQETLRRLVNTVLEHQKGSLQDDATVLLAEWRPGADERPEP